jgi:4-amino-4-deoxy-L-arabinose transferase-like glycosyltransferase
VGFPWYAITILTLLAVAAAALRFHGIAYKSFWTDEGTSIEIVRLDWYNFARILWRREGNMALYYFLLHAWSQFGGSETFIRSLSILPALATLPPLYAIGRHLFSPRVGLVAALLLTVNAYHVRYSQEARSYTLYVFLCVLSSLYFVRFVQEPSRRNRVLHVVTSGLAVYAHFYAGLLIIAQWISLRLLDRPEVADKAKRNWRDIALAVFPAVLFVATTGTGLLSWISRPGLKSLESTALDITGNGGLWLVLAYLAVCGVAILPVRPWGTGQKWADWRYQFLLLWLLFPIAAMLAISQAKPLFLPRYFIFVLPALVLLAAAGLDRLWGARSSLAAARFYARRALFAAAVLILVALSVRGDLAYYRKDFDIAREDWRGATQYILNNSRPGDVIVFHQPMGRMPYEYYRGLDGAGNPPAVIYPRTGYQLTYKDFYAGHPPEPFLDEVERQHGRVWVVLSHNQTISGADPTTRFLDGSFARAYREVKVERFPEIEVRTYER